MCWAILIKNTAKSRCKKVFNKFPMLLEAVSPQTGLRALKSPNNRNGGGSWHMRPSSSCNGTGHRGVRWYTKGTDGIMAAQITPDSNIL